MRVVPVTNITTETPARAFVLDWVDIYGIPLLLLTDIGTQFISKFFQTMCRLLGIKQLFTTAYHPSTNGQVERFNQTVLKSVTHFVSEHQDDWDDIAGVATHSYNTTIQSTTRFAPFELILSRVSSPGILQPDIAFGGDSPLASKAVFRQNFLRRVEKLGKAVGEICPFGSRDTRTTMIVMCKGEILRSSLVILSMSRRFLLSLVDLLTLNSPRRDPLSSFQAM
jgi:hypothetical protein